MSTAPVTTDNPGSDDDHHDPDEEMPRMQITRRNALAFGIFVVSAIAFIYFVLPKISGIDKTWERLRGGDPIWLVVAAVLELLSFGGYVAIFRTVFVRDSERISWAASYEITMAGLAATRLFAAGGAGGIALTAWALRRSGMPPRTVATRMVEFIVILYLVYVVAVVVFALGLDTGLFHGGTPAAFTTVPAVLGIMLLAGAIGVSFVPAGIERRMHARAVGHGHLSRLAARLASVPDTVGAGVRGALGLIRQRHPGLLGAVAWWGFDISVLWACFHAFNSTAPPVAVIVLAYFIGTIANLLPLPGGIGGVEGGMSAVFVAFGVDFNVAFLAVVVYRAFSFWLPTVPGAIAYLQLRHTVNRWALERRNVRSARGTIQSEVTT